MNEYADEDGNMSMKIRQRFRDTDEIKSRRRVILAALTRHEEEDLCKSHLGPWHLHELEGEAEEDGGAAAAVVARGLGAGAGCSRGTCVLLCAALLMYI